MVNVLLQCVNLVLALLILSSTISFATPPPNFNTAKKVAFDLFVPHKLTLYCGCQFDDEKRVDLTSCNMHTATVIERANRVEWEHMMPAEKFGRYHKCWTEKMCINEKTGKEYRGRKCCQKIDSEYRRKEAELYNLWPAVGAINQARSNYDFGILHNKRGFYGCEFEADSRLKIAEPPDRSKGIVARANLFMADKYHVELTPGQRELFQRWSKQFPPDFWELRWAAEVTEIVGYTNPYIKVEQTA